MTWRADVIDGPILTYQFLGLDEEDSPQFGAQLPTYNLNIAPQVYTKALAPFRIEPSIPKRVFAGDPADTVFLTFADEAAAIEHLAEYWTEII